MGRLLRGYKAAFAAERFRPEAKRLRTEIPGMYEQILAQAEGSKAAGVAARDPDAYVALFLAAAAKEGLLDTRSRREPEQPQEQA